MGFNKNRNVYGGINVFSDLDNNFYIEGSPIYSSRIA
jgi:hypothetical protein